MNKSAEHLSATSTNTSTVSSDRWHAFIASPRSSRLLLIAGLCLIALSIGCVLLFTGCSSGAGGSAPTQDQSSESDADQAATPEPSPEEKLAAEVKSTIESMTLEQKVAQLFFITPESLTGMDTVIQAGPTTQTALEKYPVGGLIYFKQNLVEPEQTTLMLTNTQNYAEQALGGVPIFLSVDEEGGTVSRIGGNSGFSIPNVGDMAAIGATGDPAKAEATAETIGRYLTDLGFNTDFAPVADVATNPDGSMMQRSFGDDPTLVASMVEAQVKGFLSSGILCAVKHFPGIGGVANDPHTGEIVSDLSLADIESTELAPFEAAIDAGVPFVMMGHLKTPVATNDSLPASVSKSWIQDTLRGLLHYDGIVITDSLSMGAVNELYSADRLGVEVIKAGNDMILMPEDFATTYNGVLAAVNSGELTEDRIDESLTRILTIKLRDLK